MSGTQFPLRKVSVTINGSATSPEVNLSGMTLVGIETPSGISGSSMTITCATTTGGTFVTAKDKSGNDFTLTIVASKRYILSPADTRGFDFIKLVSSASETNKTFTLICSQIA